MKCGASNSHIVLPGLLVGEENEFDAWVESLVGTGELHPLGLNVSCAGDVDGEAVRVPLWAPAIHRIGGALRSVPMQRKKLCAKDVDSWLNVAGERKCVDAVMLKNLFIRPELCSSRSVLGKIGDLATDALSCRSQPR